MKRLIFDQNLSPRLITRLADLYPNSTHTDVLELGTEADRKIWEFALLEDYIIVTKDADFSELSVLKGLPPQVIWIRLGNCSTQAIENLIRINCQAICQFVDEATMGVLTLF